MTTPLYDLSALDQTEVDNVRALLRTAINNYTDKYDLNRGVIHDIVLELSALLTAATEADVDQVRENASLSAITSDPTAVADSVVDSVAANYRVYRKAGTKASGTVAIVLSSDSSVTIKKGSTFTISGVTFVATETITSKPTTTVINPITLPYARVVTNVGNRYVFTVAVEAQSNGAGGNIPAGIAVTVTSPPPRFIQAYTYGAMTGGTDDESNQSMVNRLLAGASIQAWGSRSSIEGMLMANYSDIVDTSFVGAGDAEMLRDKHGLVPISVGGKTDAYIRTGAFYETKVVTMTATLTTITNSTTSTWRLVIGRDIAPGFYDVQKVLLTTKLLTESGFTPTSDTRNYDVSGTIYVPDIVNGLEATYSRYQTAEVYFVDNVTSTAGLVANTSTKSYQVVFRCMPNLSEIQEWLGDSSHRSLSSDVLVKAPVPVFTTMSFNLVIPKANATPDLNAVKTAVTAAVNSQGFSDRLTSSVIASAVKSVISNASVDSLSLSGTLRKPNGTTVSLSGSSAITITADTANMVSSNTVVFFVSNGDITITTVRI
jgi:hypothetical protein